MLKRIHGFLEKWGHYLLALLCVGVIVLSAAWAGKLHRPQGENAPAAADQAQRLSDAAKQPEETRLLRPVPGEMLRGFSEEMVWDETLALWYIHPALDFHAEAGDAVFAMAAGRVEIQDDLLIIHHENGDRSQYRGLAVMDASDGQQVKAGAKIGVFGGATMEGEGNHLCVRYERQGRTVDFLHLLTEP